MLTLGRPRAPILIRIPSTGAAGRERGSTPSASPETLMFPRFSWVGLLDDQSISSGEIRQDREWSTWAGHVHPGDRVRGAAAGAGCPLRAAPAQHLDGAVVWL